MGVQASLPPYAHLQKEAVQCIAQASVRYEVPELLLHSILMKEGGRSGQCVTNRNRTKDCGLAQINTSWAGYFKEKYKLGFEQISQDACTNIYVSAYILKTNFNLKGHWFYATMAYNIGPNNWTDTRYRIGHAYASDVFARWRGFHAYVERNSPNFAKRAKDERPRLTEVGVNSSNSSAPAIESSASVGPMVAEAPARQGERLNQ